MANGSRPRVRDHGAVPEIPEPPELRRETVMLTREAYLGATKIVNWREAPGRVSAEMICPYPPGIPITAPGERLTDKVVVYLQQLAAAGVMVEGADEAASGASGSMAGGVANRR
jgi:arginine decarboxylase